MIKYLWVKEDLRGQGTGKKLLWEAEKEAEKRNCKYVFLDTFSFRLRNFIKNTDIKSSLRWRTIRLQERDIITPKA